eukprot:1176856-Prorocentrum_minimum.AAC.1
MPPLGLRRPALALVDALLATPSHHPKGADSTLEGADSTPEGAGLDSGPPPDPQLDEIFCGSGGAGVMLGVRRGALVGSLACAAVVDIAKSSPAPQGAAP